MKFDLAQFVQRGHRFAIVDEVDSILIDEARTPLIISGPAEESTDLYYEVDRIIPKLTPGAVTQGNVKAEDRERARDDRRLPRRREAQDRAAHRDAAWPRPRRCSAHRLVPGSAGLYDPANMPLLHHIHQGLRAHTLFKLDVDYMVKDGQVVIVDEFTGRLMPGRRWSDGLHQAVEAKEKVKIERENQTLATITFQNYFRKYKKLSGMTGTAETEAEEFAKIYKLDVIVVPPNRPLRARKSRTASTAPSARSTTRSSTTSSRKQEAGRPTLVGTVSIEKSEKLSGMLKRRGVKHVVLNAKYHAQEAEIVAQAGRRGDGHDRHQHGRPRHRHPARRQPRVHGAPADAGRSDRRAAAEGPGEVRRRRRVRLLLPPRELLSRAAQGLRADLRRSSRTQTDAEHEEVVDVGGLHIIGTERHEARRIDNQLRGRAGRQGDPGLVALLSLARRRPDAHLRHRTASPA